MIKDTVSSLSIPQIFISKRFVTGVVALVGMVLVALVPQLADSAPMIEASILAIASLIITSYTGQDWKVAEAQGASKYQPASING